MRSVILIAVTLLTPSLADAFDGVFTMRGLTQTKYYLADSSHTTDQKYLTYYTLRAEEQISHKNIQTISNSFNKATAHKVLMYKNGSIDFSDASIKFQTGFYHRGIFYMQNTHGTINGQQFSSRELAFRESQEVISAEHIVFRTDLSMKVRKSYRSSIPKLHPTTD